MKLKDIYGSDKKIISFEVFPPKLDFEPLLKELAVLNRFNPAFISLTCGASGKENKSFDLIRKISGIGYKVMPHFTCISSSKETIEEELKILENMGIENLLALRGDLPQNNISNCRDFNYANELVEFIKKRTDFSLAVAGYPEGHIESLDFKTDLDNLKRKVEAGADAIFTQLFFNNSMFYKFVQSAREVGISVPIVAGIMPIINTKQILKMTSLAKISIPKAVLNAMESYDSLEEFGIEYASLQCEDLIKNGFNNLHFYTLNKSYSTMKILENMRL